MDITNSLDNSWMMDCLINIVQGRERLKRDGTRAETRFGLSEKWTSPFKLAGESVQSTTGSRGVWISGQTMDRPCSKVQCKSNGYPLQSPISPSLPLPCVTMCHHVTTASTTVLSSRIYPRFELFFVSHKGTKTNTHWFACPLSGNIYHVGCIRQTSKYLL